MSARTARAVGARGEARGRPECRRCRRRLRLPGRRTRQCHRQPCGQDELDYTAYFEVVGKRRKENRVVCDRKHERLINQSAERPDQETNHATAEWPDRGRGADPSIRTCSLSTNAVRQA